MAGRLVKNHPVLGTRTVEEHVRVAAEKYGRAPRKGEHVHHRDKNHGNNDPDNLEIVTKSQHTRLHYDDLFSEEARHKISEKQKAHWAKNREKIMAQRETSGHTARAAAARHARGYALTDEQRANVKAAAQNRVMPPQWRANVKAAAQKRGSTITQAGRAALKVQAASRRCPKTGRLLPRTAV